MYEDRAVVPYYRYEDTGAGERKKKLAHPSEDTGFLCYGNPRGHQTLLLHCLRCNSGDPIDSDNPRVYSLRQGQCSTGCGRIQPTEQTGEHDGGILLHESDDSAGRRIIEARILDVSGHGLYERQYVRLEKGLRGSSGATLEILTSEENSL